MVDSDQELPTCCSRGHGLKTLFLQFSFLLEGLHDLRKETKLLSVNVASQDIHLNNTEPKIAVSDLSNVSFRLSEQG